MSFHDWIITPRDPLVVRDGRPFEAVQGSSAHALPFPFPSTIIGNIRTRSGSKETGIFDTARISDVLKHKLYGPLLLKAGEKPALLVPRPDDALMMLTEDKETLSYTLYPLKPINLKEGEGTSLEAKLSPVGLASSTLKGKPKGMPRYWYWDKFLKWLKNPVQEAIIPTELGSQGPSRDLRVHVQIKAETQTAEKSRLFQVEGLAFQNQQDSVNKNKEKNAWPTMSSRLRVGELEHFSLYISTDANLGQESFVTPLGGERRLTLWQRCSELGIPKTCPEELCDSIATHKACRVVLLTPAHFQQGWEPTWLLAERHGVQPILKGSALGRAAVVSGWDFKKGNPKPTRRLVPAGSVFFLELDGDEQNIRQWVKDIWWQNISDDIADDDPRKKGDREMDSAQDRRDGFGLAVLGMWSGKNMDMRGGA